MSTTTELRITPWQCVEYDSDCPALPESLLNREIPVMPGQFALWGVEQIALRHNWDHRSMFTLRFNSVKGSRRPKKSDEEIRVVGERSHIPGGQQQIGREPGFGG